jgi:hypothetical protein
MNPVFHHDNCTTVCAQGCYLLQLGGGWIGLPYPLNSPNLAPSDFNIFGFLLDALRGRRFAEDRPQHGVRRGRRRFSESFMRPAYKRRKQRWEWRGSVLIMKERVLENNQSFVTNVQLMNLNCVSVPVVV